MKKERMLTAILVSVLAVLVACAPQGVGYEENFDDWEEINWEHHGLVYLLEEEERGKVLCFGGIGEMLPKGWDGVEIGLDIPSEGAIIEFDYKVEYTSMYAYFEVTTPRSYLPWQEVKEPSQWQYTSFLAEEVFLGLDDVHLILRALRSENGSTGVVACIDNFKVRQASDRSAKPTPIESLGQ